MNNACPGCGAVYAVTAKDIGRKIKCKKCSTALAVTDAGLVVEGGVPAVAAAVAVEADEGDDISSSTKNKKAKRYGGGGGAGQFVEKIGGTPTLLFGIGTVFVIFFFFQANVISEASKKRAEGGYDRVKFERDQKIRQLTEDKDIEDMTPEALAEFQKEVAKQTKKINKDFRKPLSEASDDKALGEISAKRSPWLDQYGLMIGFLFLSMGCLAYVRSDNHLVVRIVGGTILTVLMMAIFAKFSGCAR